MHGPELRFMLRVRGCQQARHKLFKHGLAGFALVAPMPFFRSAQGLQPRRLLHYDKIMITIHDANGRFGRFDGQGMVQHVHHFPCFEASRIIKAYPSIDPYAPGGDETTSFGPA